MRRSKERRTERAEDERSRVGFRAFQYDARAMLTILFLGDVVGEPGRSAVIANLARLKESHAVDFVVINGENAAGGRGVTRSGERRVGKEGRSRWSPDHLKK